MRTAIILGMMVALLTAAMSKPPTPNHATLPDGVWQTDGYGQILRVSGRNFDLYDLTSNTCLFNSKLEGVQAMEWIGAVVLSPDNRHAVLRSGVSRIAVEKLDEMPKRCTNSPSLDPLENFDVFWTTFDEHYAFFERRKLDWTAIRNEFRTQARAASPEQLFDIFSRIITRLKDSHVSIVADDKAFKAEKSPAATSPDADGIVPTRKNLQRALKDYISGTSSPLLQAATPLGNNRIWYGKLAPNIGYMSVFTMGGFEEDDVTSSDHAESARRIFQYIAKEFETVQAVIVDLRYNQGGYDAVSLELAGLFAADRHVAFRKKAFRSKGNKYDVVLTPSSPRRLAVPVAVLISEHSVSAAETAAVAFRTLSNAKLVGQQTQGALSDVLEKKLPNGWTFTLSNEIFETVDGEFPEGTGVLPHIATPQTGNPGSAMERFLPDIERARDALLHSR